jgi:hypothetical protein
VSRNSNSSCRISMSSEISTSPNTTGPALVAPARCLQLPESPLGSREPVSDVRKAKSCACVGPTLLPAAPQMPSIGSTAWLPVCRSAAGVQNRYFCYWAVVRPIQANGSSNDRPSTQP